MVEHIMGYTPESVLQTNSHCIGVDYLTHPYREIFLKCLAAGGLAASLPAITLAGAAIYIVDRHNPLVQLHRPHPGFSEGTHLTKLQTMPPKATASEQQKAKGLDLMAFKRTHPDPRVTRLGWFLRKTSMDELPQFADVVRGQLSLVGPRPFTEYEWNSCIYPRSEEYPYEQFIQLLKQKVMYGLTGMYGIFGRAELTLEERLSLEVLYGERASFKGDLRILFLTGIAVSRRKGAY